MAWLLELLLAPLAWTSEIRPIRANFEFTTSHASAPNHVIIQRISWILHKPTGFPKDKNKNKNSSSLN